MKFKSSCGLHRQLGDKLPAELNRKMLKISDQTKPKTFEGKLKESFVVDTLNKF